MKTLFALFVVIGVIAQEATAQWNPSPVVNPGGWRPASSPSEPCRVPSGPAPSGPSISATSPESRDCTVTDNPGGSTTFSCPGQASVTCNSGACMTEMQVNGKCLAAGAKSMKALGKSFVCVPSVQNAACTKQKVDLAISLAKQYDECIAKPQGLNTIFPQGQIAPTPKAHVFKPAPTPTPAQQRADRDAYDRADRSFDRARSDRGHMDRNQSDTHDRDVRSRTA